VPKIPRNVKQNQAIRAFIRLGGVETYDGKGSHRRLLMPNGRKLTIPAGTLTVGLLADSLKEAGLSVEEFIEAL
jgi:predicted RNA binding protein YcfA (HicA-like mRNA interferase family)